ncbi:MAG: hypothetical protein ACXV3S_11570 [Kineosporiaceae bacterium]
MATTTDSAPLHQSDRRWRQRSEEQVLDTVLVTDEPGQLVCAAAQPRRSVRHGPATAAQPSFEVEVGDGAVRARPG